MEPHGLNQYWKAEFFAGLPSGLLEAFRDAALGATSPLSYSVLFHIGAR